MCRNTFFFVSVQSWNLLPEYIVKSKSLSILKNECNLSCVLHMMLSCMKCSKNLPCLSLPCLAMACLSYKEYQQNITCLFVIN